MADLSEFHTKLSPEKTEIGAAEETPPATSSETKMEAGGDASKSEKASDTHTSSSDRISSDRSSSGGSSSGESSSSRDRPCEEGAIATTPRDLDSLSYRQLQAACKAAGLKATGKRARAHRPARRAPLVAGEAGRRRCHRPRGHPPVLTSLDLDSPGDPSPAPTGPGYGSNAPIEGRADPVSSTPPLPRGLTVFEPSISAESKHSFQNRRDKIVFCPS